MRALVNTRYSPSPRERWATTLCSTQHTAHRMSQQHEPGAQLADKLVNVGQFSGAANVLQRDLAWLLRTVGDVVEDRSVKQIGVLCAPTTTHQNRKRLPQRGFNQPETTATAAGTAATTVPHCHAARATHRHATPDHARRARIHTSTHTHTQNTPG